MSIPDPTGREASAARPGALLPPYSEEAEAIALGAVLLDPETMLDLCRVHQLVPESFYLSGHRTIYEAMLEMAAAHRPLEIPALVEHLTQTGRLEAAGGEDALLAIVSRATSVAYAEYYIKRVFENHLLRRVLDAAREVTESCYRADLGAEGVLERAESAFFALSENRAGTEKPWRDLVKQEMVEAERLLSEKKSLTGISTGFVDIDAKLLGMQKSDLLILAARPSMGKTSLALNIAENVATGARRQPVRPVAVFSLEMSAEALVRRMICCRAHVSAKDLSTGRLGVSDHAQLVQAASTSSPTIPASTTASEPPCPTNNPLERGRPARFHLHNPPFLVEAIRVRAAAFETSMSVLSSRLPPGPQNGGLGDSFAITGNPLFSP